MKKEDLEYLKDVLEDITYWETCPDNYKKRFGVLIELISEELTELKKLRVGDVSVSVCDCIEEYDLHRPLGNTTEYCTHCGLKAK